MKKANDLDLAWAAGFFDGEGSVVIWHRPNAKVDAGTIYSLRVSVGCTNPLPLAKLLSLFGGKVYLRKSLRVNWKPCFMWYLYSNQAVEFLKNLLPFFILKRPQAELGIKFQQCMRETRGTKSGYPKDIRQTAQLVATREAMRLNLVALNKRGL